MTEPSSTVGLVVIFIWYAVIGLLATAGSVAVSQKFFPGRSEQIFYGALLVPIAGYYLACVAYFANVSSWRIELIGVIAFSVARAVPRPRRRAPCTAFGMPYMNWLGTAASRPSDPGSSQPYPLRTERSARFSISRSPRTSSAVSSSGSKAAVRGVGLRVCATQVNWQCARLAAYRW